MITTIRNLFLIFFFAAVPVFAQDSSNDIINKMQTSLNLTQDQIYHITPVVEKYVQELADLQKSIDDGTINQSAVDSQKQQMKAIEDQDLSEYLTANQISQWNYIESQDQPQEKASSDDDSGGDQYTNLPKNGSSLVPN